MEKHTTSKWKLGNKMHNRSNGIEDYKVEESKGNNEQNYYLSISYLYTSLDNITIPLTTLTYHSVLLH